MAYEDYIKTSEEIAQDYLAMEHSVNLINAGQPEDMDDNEWIDTLDRNVRHLELMLTKDFWTYEDMTEVIAILNTEYATQGDDFLIVTSYTSSVQAGAGTDTVIFSDNYADYTFSQSDSYVPLMTNNTTNQVVSLFGASTPSAMMQKVIH
jgi:hypothetical protein